LVAQALICGRSSVNEREEKRSLGTRNPEEAKRRHAEALSEIEAQWAKLRRGVGAQASKQQRSHI
jgi:hypothetical protein